MDLLRRYLNAVKFWLPAKQQDDIIAELSEDLRSQVEEREAALGRNLTQTEWEALLKERGHPLVVANAYVPQRYLIGPVLFPVYLFVLKLAMLCCLIPSLAVWLGMLILVPANAPVHASFWGALWPSLVTGTAVTLVFAVIEGYQETWLGLWSPSKLPAVRDTPRIARGTSLFDIVVNGMFAGWAIQAILTPALVDRPGLRIALTQTGREALLGFTAIALGFVLVGAVNLVKPYWARPRHGLHATSCGMSIVLFALILRVQPLLDIAPHSLVPDAVHMADGQAFRGAIWGAIVVTLFLGAIELWKALRREKPQSPLADALTLSV